jgi:hypothetical protein
MRLFLRDAQSRCADPQLFSFRTVCQTTSKARMSNIKANSAATTLQWSNRKQAWGRYQFMNSSSTTW